MNTNYKSNILAKRHRKILTAVCLSAFLFITATFAQTPPLRANGKIAFTSDRDGNREIYVMNADGSNQTRITNNSIVDEHPAWSPDGRKIAFISQKPTGQYAIFQMNADGTGKTEITPVNYQPSSGFADGWTISWSPDGSQIVFRDGQGNAAFVSIVNADGSNRRFLTSGYGPAWSPDGSKVLFIRGASQGTGTLHTIRTDGTDLRTLPPLPNNFFYYNDATWSPTGSEIAITAFDTANFVIFISNADGTNAREFHYQCGEFSLGCSLLAAPSWSPDGRTIAFHASDSEIEIYVKDIAGGESRRLTNTNGNNFQPSWQPLDRASTLADFDGDGRSDISVFRPSDGTWYLDQSTNGFSATSFGLSSDKITPADYDGDGRTDIAVFRDGFWYWLNSSDGSFQAAQFGQTGDIPVPADYTGDGRAEIAVFRGGFWYSLDLANNQFTGLQFGFGSDKPVPADYDGDGKADVAVVRQENGLSTWYIQGTTNGFYGFQFGADTDKLVPADYDGDGKTDIAVYRNGTWYLQQSNLGFTAFQFGNATDLPAPADYDGDGKADAAVYRNGVWYLLQSTSGISIQQFGLANDKPVPAAYLP